jgi:uncharacterized protein GlcG (DUF336 family)
MKSKLNLWKSCLLAAVLALSVGALSAGEDKDHDGKKHNGKDSKGHDGKDDHDQPKTSDKPGKDLPSQAQLKAALQAVVASGTNGGLGLNMWATLVNRDGVVVAVAFSGANRGEQWPGSRVISAQKANTANAFSLPGLALSTANLYSAVQPGGTLFGLQESNPVDTSVAYRGPSENYGQPNDPMVGRKIGGINVFGGGLACYDQNGKLVGALGVSGDTSCADHVIAWKVRNALNLDNVPGGVSPTHDDNIIYDVTNGVSAGGFGHPECSADATSIANSLPTTHPVGPNP